MCVSINVNVNVSVSVNVDRLGIDEGWRGWGYGESRNKCKPKK
jgi:hypothetical protein